MVGRQWHADSAMRNRDESDSIAWTDAPHKTRDGLARALLAALRQRFVIDDEEKTAVEVDGFRRTKCPPGRAGGRRRRIGSRWQKPQPAHISRFPADTQHHFLWPEVHDRPPLLVNCGKIQSNEKTTGHTLLTDRCCDHEPEHRRASDQHSSARYRTTGAVPHAFSVTHRSVTGAPPRDLVERPELSHRRSLPFAQTPPHPIS